METTAANRVAPMLKQLQSHHSTLTKELVNLTHFIESTTVKQEQLLPKLKKNFEFMHELSAWFTDKTPQSAIEQLTQSLIHDVTDSEAATFAYQEACACELAIIDIETAVTAVPLAVSRQESLRQELAAIEAKIHTLNAYVAPHTATITITATTQEG